PDEWRRWTALIPSRVVSMLNRWHKPLRAGPIERFSFYQDMDIYPGSDHFQVAELLAKCSDGTLADFFHLLYQDARIVSVEIDTQRVRGGTNREALWNFLIGR